MDDKDTEIQRLREALQFYANGNNYRKTAWRDAYDDFETYPPAVLNDRGQRAREALEAKNGA